MFRKEKFLRSFFPSFLADLKRLYPLKKKGIFMPRRLKHSETRKQNCKKKFNWADNINFRYSHFRSSILQIYLDSEN
jgi:hypothetical protein